MRKKEKAALVKATLDKYFPNPPVPLNSRNTYTFLLAVLLSARCTDARVNQVTPTLFDLADTPQKMLKLSPEKIREIIKPCGLSPQKSKAIFELSKILVDSCDSEVPCSFELLESLPGVGHKTASVVMAQAFGVPAFPVDTHIYRCARRWGLSKGNTVVKVERDLKALFDEKDWIRLHLQIIYYARKYCPALGHQIEACPICSSFEKSEGGS